MEPGPGISRQIPLRILTSPCGWTLTKKLGRQPLDRSIAGSVGAALRCRPWRTAEDLVQDLEVPKALAGELALDLDALPALEAVCRGPVPEKSAVGLGDGRLELCLDHVEGPGRAVG